MLSQLSRLYIHKFFMWIFCTLVIKLCDFRLPLFKKPIYATARKFLEIFKELNIKNKLLSAIPNFKILSFFMIEYTKEIIWYMHSGLKPKIDIFFEDEKNWTRPSARPVASLNYTYNFLDFGLLLTLLPSVLPTFGYPLYSIVWNEILF